jgi:hypothetical protein
MSVLSTTWRELVRRRLLPVALLLVAALAAIPFLLAREPEPVTPPVTAAPASQKPTAASAEPIVSLVEDGERTRRRRVLGTRKNPFEPAPVKLPKPEAAPAPAPTGASAAPQAGGGSGSAPSGSPAPSYGAPSFPAPPSATPEPDRPRHLLYSLAIRFGDAATVDGLRRMNLPRLTPLPDEEQPVVVYLGVQDGGKVAVFLVDSDVVAQGDGACRPHPANCQTIHLREGETEFFDVVDEQGNVSAQYQLDLIKIHRRTTASSSRAKAARAKASEAGRRLLRAHVADAGPLRYRYDRRTGTLERMRPTAWKALAAKLAALADGARAQR